jgi:hypothetical protein
MSFMAAMAVGWMGGEGDQRWGAATGLYAWLRWFPIRSITQRDVQTDIINAPLGLTTPDGLEPAE